jgi:hypothetical protein
MEPSADKPTPEETSAKNDIVAQRNDGPDPVIGAGLTLLGIFVMGLGGSRDWHYVFNAGTFVAIIGAAVFVLFVALSAMKQRSSDQAKHQGT